MFNWIRNLFQATPTDWGAVNRADEIRDGAYMENFNGFKGPAEFSKATCRVKFHYGNGPAPTYRTIRGRTTTFTGGTVVSGDYSCDVWADGTFNGDTLSCKVWRNGTFNGKHLVCANVCGGNVTSGIVECSNWEDGAFSGKTLVCENWNGGTFNGDTFHGKWRGGVWNGKSFKGINLTDAQIPA